MRSLVGTASIGATGSATCLPSSAAEIPLPEQDTLYVRADIHDWRATDEQAVCASWIGKHAEAFALCGGCWRVPTSPTMTGNGLRSIATCVRRR